MMLTGESHYAKRRERIWKGDDLAGVILVVAVIIFLLIMARKLRHDRAANMRHRLEARNRWNGAMRHFDADTKQPLPDPDDGERAGGKPKAPKAGAALAALPDRITAADVAALSPEARDRLLRGVRAPRK